MNRWKVAFLKSSGVALQVGAGFLFVFAGDMNEIPLLFPAITSAIGGLILWGKGARALDAPPSPPPAIERAAPPVEELLLALQEDVGRLREDQEFFRELYAAESARRKELGGAEPGSSGAPGSAPASGDSAKRG